MIEIHSIRIHRDPPGLSGKYLCEVRLVDWSQGTVTTEHGTFLKWDKGLALQGTQLASLLRRVGDTITEVLCR